MLKNEEDGSGPVNRQRGTRPKQQKKRLGKIREKGSWYKRPAGSAMDSEKPTSVGPQEKPAPGHCTPHL